VGESYISRSYWFSIIVNQKPLSFTVKPVSIVKREMIDLAIVENFSINSEGKPSPFPQNNSLRN